MRFQILLPLGIVLALSACKKEKPVEVPTALHAFPAIILPPNASFVSQSGSSEALSVLWRTTAKLDATANYYRAAFRPPSWRLISDGKDNSGATLLYAERDGRPLWVRIYPDSAFNATFVEMTGAVTKLHPDSTRAPTDSEAIAAGKRPQPASTFVPLSPPTTVPQR